MHFLAPERGGLFVDCTVGLGGHSEAILESSTETRVIGIDRDSAALSSASRRVSWRTSVFRPYSLIRRRGALVFVLTPRSTCG